MTPGYAKPRIELPWLPYPESDSVNVINSHNFASGGVGFDNELLLLRAGTGVTDQSSEGNDGSLVGDASVESDYFSLDGTGDSISLGNPASLQLESSAMTVAGWYYPIATGRSVFTKGTSRGSNGTRSFDLFDNGSTLLWMGLNGSGALFVVTTPRPSLNAWHFFAASWDGGSTAKLTIDTTTVAGSKSAGAILAGLEWSLGGSVDPFRTSGRMDDLRIFDRVLSASELADWHTAGRGYDAP